MLNGEEEARLAFAGATRTFAQPPHGGRRGRVGGGSTESRRDCRDGRDVVALGPAIGSGVLAEEHLRADPPCASGVAGDARRSRSPSFATLPEAAA